MVEDRRENTTDLEKEQFPMWKVLQRNYIWITQTGYEGERAGSEGKSSCWPKTQGHCLKFRADSRDFSQGPTLWCGMSIHISDPKQ